MLKNTRELERQIEKLVSDHLAACHKAVAAAVERAFAAAQTEPAPGQMREETKPRTPRARRRTAEELAVLGERFYAAVCATPGETMSSLAAQLGTSPRSLWRPVAQLKDSGRVRSVGQRQYTHYFPMSMDETATKESLAVVRRAS